MAVTLDDLAKELGVSKATVSRALNNDRLIHPATRSEVLAAAVRAGYERPSKRGPTPPVNHPRIHLLIPSGLALPENYVFPQYLRGLTRGTSEAECHLGVAEIPYENSGKLHKRGNLPREIQDGRVDAIVLAGRHASADVAALGKIAPVVSLQWDHQGIPVDVVSTFNQQGVASLVNLLIANGHRRIAWVGDRYDASFHFDRHAGFLRACLEGNLEISSALNFQNMNPLLEPKALVRLLKSGVTAIVCAQDMIATELGEAAIREKIHVPRDLSLVGFDAWDHTLSNGKILTSYDPVFVELGRTAIWAAMQRLKDPGAPKLVHMREGRIQEGQTAAATKS